MTATTDFNASNVTVESSSDFSRLAWKKSFAFSKIVSFTVGAALMACSIGMWLAPAVAYDPGSLIFKLALSFVSAIGGIALLHSASKTVSPDVEFDQIRREIRIVRRGSKVDEVLRTVSFEELGEVLMKDGMIVAHDTQGEVLIELPIEDPKAYRALRRQLTAA